MQKPNAFLTESIAGDMSPAVFWRSKRPADHSAIRKDTRISLVLKTKETEGTSSSVAVSGRADVCFENSAAVDFCSSAAIGAQESAAVLT